MRFLAGAVAAVALLGVACSADKKNASDGSVNDALAEQQVPNDLTCQEIRSCTWFCMDDACIDMCEARGAAAGRATYQALRACFVGAGCSASDFYCGCDQGCFPEGQCLEQVTACLGTLTTDIVCDDNCH
jgi:hypothetical protein